MFSRIKRIQGVIFLLALSWVVGCAQTKTVPGYARAGDHVVLGLGGIERNVNGEVALARSDLTITLTDANNVVHNLEARYLFKSFPDYSSWLTGSNLEGTITNYALTDMVPFDGGWFAVVPLTYPGQYTSPLPLAVGDATVAVTSPKLTPIGNAVEGDLSAIPIEIIPGTSAPDSEYIRQFLGYLDNGRNFLIEPDDLTGVSEVGGAYLVIDYNDDSFFRPGVEPVVVPAGHNPFAQLSYNHVPNGDGTGTLYVTLLNPAGFKTLANLDQNSSLLSDLRVRLNYFPSNNQPWATEAKASFSVDVANSYYIDMNGDVIANVTPVMTHVEDL